jgi:hypothetical protein
VRLGAENRTKLIIAISLGVVALVLAGSRFVGSFGGGSSSAAAPAPVNVAESSPQALPPPAPRNPRKNRSAGKKEAGTGSLDPTLRYDLLRASEDTKYGGAGRDIFRVHVDIPPPVAPVSTGHGAIGPQLPPPPPPPPPINLKYYGFASKPGEPKRIFIKQGEDVFIAGEGDIVDRRYKVVRISPTAVEILDVLSNNRQSIPLTQG